MQFTAKMYSLNEKFHTVNGRTDGHVLTEISRYHFSLPMVLRYKRVSMGCWLLRLSAKILAHLRLSVNFFQLRLTKKLKINFFVSKS